LSTQEKVLIVEDEENERSGLAELVSAWGYRTETAKDGLEGLEKVATWSPGIVVTDFRMPRMDGMELLQRLAEQPQPIAVVLLTAQGSIDVAVDAMKAGAYDFIQKPVEPARLKQILQNAARQRGTSLELEATKRKLRDTGLFGQMVGASREMQEIFHLIEMVAPSTASVLITGESGTGKEMVARTIHDLSPRKNKPFVAINCSAIPETLIESEIFGHEKGAFTGAMERRAGCFELAEEGTLLLDEIGEMPAATQAKLLRVLEDRKLRRLGSKSETPVDVRVLAATNKVPEEAISRGELRQDLYYRLNVFHISLPPLRERKQDIAPIADALLPQLNQKHSCKVTGLDPALMERLEEYDWPGNARELRNVIQRILILNRDREVDEREVEQALGGSGQALDVHQALRSLFNQPLREAREQFERAYLEHHLRRSDGNVVDVAGISGIERTHLYRKLKQLGLSPKSSKE
jgi:DNA-binding NtrC family response regulator